MCTVFGPYLCFWYRAPQTIVINEKVTMVSFVMLIRQLLHYT